MSQVLTLAPPGKVVLLPDRGEIFVRDSGDGDASLGPVLLLWVLYRNVYPVPEFPNNLWPYVALAWVAASWALMKIRPAVVSAPLPDYS